MVHLREHDVPVQTKYPEKLAPDGSTNTTAIYVACLRRMLDIVDDEKYQVGDALRHG